MLSLMHNNKFPGPDGWPNPLIKSLSEFIAILLSIIAIQQVIQLQNFTFWLENAQVTLFIRNVLET